MKKAFLLSLLVASLCVSCTATTNLKGDLSVSRDDLLRKQIIGKWAEGISPYGISAFHEEGIYEAWGYESPNKRNLIVSAKGKWWIENGYLYNIVHEIDPAVPGLKTNEVIIDKIVDISENTMLLIDKGGTQYSKNKVIE